MTEDNVVYQSSIQAGILLIPALAIMAVFLYYPTMETLRLSFFKTFLLGQGTTYVGLENFTALLTSESYHRSVVLSFVFAGIVIIGTLSVSVVLSFLIHRATRGKRLYLIASIWPFAIPTAVAGTVFLFLVHPRIGVYTRLLEAVFDLDINWFASGSQALVVVALATIWKQLGFNIIFLLAALNNLPESLVESAKLDGVGPVKMLFRVYIPLISPTLIFLLVMNTIYSFFGSFAFVDLMTGGGPNGMTNILIFKLYQDAFAYDNLGLASAQSIVLFALVAVLTVIQLKITDRYAYYGGA
jgi:sn-glycerol 3-phosphate transport system permease protein